LSLPITRPTLFEISTLNLGEEKPRSSSFFLLSFPRILNSVCINACPIFRLGKCLNASEDAYICGNYSLICDNRIRVSINGKVIWWGFLGYRSRSWLSISILGTGLDLGYRSRSWLLVSIVLTPSLNRSPNFSPSLLLLHGEFCVALFMSMIGWERDNVTVGPIAVAAKQSLLCLQGATKPLSIVSFSTMAILAFSSFCNN
jgi:hypothetical protein